MRIFLYALFMLVAGLRAPAMAETATVQAPIEPPIALVYPDVRPAWCGESANFCVSLKDSKVFRTTYILIKRFPKEDRYAFSFEPGTHAVRISTPYSMTVPFSIDGNGGILDCLNSRIKGTDRIKANHGAEGQGCVVSYAEPMTIKNFEIIGGEGLGPGSLSRTTKGSSSSFRCIRPHKGVVMENITLTKCRNGVQGDGAYDWTLRRVTMTDCSVKGSGKQHCIYSSTGAGTLTIEDSNLTSHAGHVVKSGNARTVIRNTTLTEGGGDTGAVVHSTSNGLVVLDNVMMTQARPSRGNVVMLLVGAGKLSRCRGPGEWRFKNVTMIDEQSDRYTKAKRIRFECLEETIAVDLGGNTYNGAALFKNLP